MKKLNELTERFSEIALDLEAYIQATIYDEYSMAIAGHVQWSFYLPNVLFDRYNLKIVISFFTFQFYFIDQVPTLILENLTSFTDILH